MKKYIILLFLIALCAPLMAQTIALTDVYSNYYCTETVYSLGFKATGSFNGDNVFEVQLSDSAGGFSSPGPVIGQLSSSSAGAARINFIIPPKVVSGARYSMRVISTDPVEQSSANNMPLTIYSPTAALSVGGNGCIEANPIVLSGSRSASVINWYLGAGTNAIQTSASPSYEASVVAGGNGKGQNADQLDYPFRVFANDSGNIYVGDFINDRVQKFPPNSNSASAGVTVASATEDNSFHPYSIFVDGNGNLYVADAQNNRILEYPSGSNASTEGVVVCGGNGVGSDANQLSSPTAVYVDGSGNIYVVDGGNNRIQKFPPNSTSGTSGVTLAGGNGAGSGVGQLNGPLSIYVDGNGFIYVYDFENSRIQKFSTNSIPAVVGTTVATFAATQMIDGGAGLYVDGSGNLFILLQKIGIEKFPPGSTPATNGIMVVADPDCIGFSMDGNGNIYTADADSNRVLKFRPVSPDNTYDPLSTGSYTASYTDWEGCVSFPSNAIVKYSAQAAPQLEKSGNELVVDNAIYLSYNWFVDSVPAINDTSVLDITKNGKYFTVAVDSNGCPDTSQVIDITDFVAIANVAQQVSLKLYPNPNAGSFMLETNNCIGHEFVIYDLVGNTIMHQPITNDKQVITVKGLSAGTYTLQMKGSADNRIRFTVYE